MNTLDTHQALAQGRPVEAHQYHDLMAHLSTGTNMLCEIEDVLQARLGMSATILGINLVMYLSDYPDAERRGYSVEEWCCPMFGINPRHYDKARQKLIDADLWPVPEEWEYRNPTTTTAPRTACSGEGDTNDT